MLVNLTWSANCVNVSTNVANQGATFTMTETKLYVPVNTLSTQDNAKLLAQLKSGFKGYLRYKTITSQNMSSEAQIKNFFIP